MEDESRTPPPRSSATPDGSSVPSTPQTPIANSMTARASVASAQAAAARLLANASPSTSAPSSSPTVVTTPSPISLATGSRRSSSATSDASIRVIHAGFLRKQSPRGVKPFQLRFFRLTSGARLEYYKPTAASLTTLPPPLGVIRLETVEDVGLRRQHYGGGVLIELVGCGPHGRKYTLLAESDEDAQRWLRLIVAERSRARMTGPGGGALGTHPGGSPRPQRIVRLNCRLPGGGIASLEAEAHLECAVVVRRLLAQVYRPGREPRDFDLVLRGSGSHDDYDGDDNDQIFTSAAGEAATLRDFRRVMRATARGHAIKCELVSTADSYRLQREQEKRRGAMLDIKTLLGLKPPSYRIPRLHALQCIYATAGLVGVAEDVGSDPVAAADMLKQLLSSKGMKNVKASCTFEGCDMNLTLPFDPCDRVHQFRDKLFATYQVATDASEPNTAFTLRVANCDTFLDTRVGGTRERIMGALKLVHDAVAKNKHVAFELVRDRGTLFGTDTNALDTQHHEDEEKPASSNSSSHDNGVHESRTTNGNTKVDNDSDTASDTTADPSQNHQNGEETPPMTPTKTPTMRKLPGSKSKAATRSTHATTTTTPTSGSIALTSLGMEYRIRVLEVAGLHNFALAGGNSEWRSESGSSWSSCTMHVEASLYHGFDPLMSSGGSRRQPATTSALPAGSNSIRCGEWLDLGTRLSDMPRGASVRLVLQVTDAKIRRAVAWVNLVCFDEDGLLRTGAMAARMWPQGTIHGDRKVPPACPMENPGPGTSGSDIEDIVANAPTLYVEVERFRLPVKHPGFELFATPATSTPTIPLASSQTATACEDGGIEKNGDAFQLQDSPRTMASMRTTSLNVQFGPDASASYEEDAVLWASLIRDPSDRDALRRCTGADPLATLDRRERALLWLHRRALTSIPEALPKVLRAVRWGIRERVYEMYALLQVWSPPPPLDTLELLGRFIDPVVREYAVSRLRLLNDVELGGIILQLAQALKFEAYHGSPLARFLLERSLSSAEIGHALFWHLRSELHCPDARERFAVLLQDFLLRCGALRTELLQQVALEAQLKNVALGVKRSGGSKEERVAAMRSSLRSLEIPRTVRIPLNLGEEVKCIRVEKCKFMDSKKLPLWVVFESANPVGDDTYVIFKCGDDLRQDQVTLQMLRLMDDLWTKNGLDLKMRPYGCVTTGDEVGMIEVVLNSETTSNISMAAGGGFACFKEEPLANWLKEHNPTQELYERAVDNFVHSCAGYCVATCVLGIGDRHNDNIMVTRDGCLFHIDFGHFLGNFKSKFGFKRERAKFVLTPDFAYVMGGKDSAGFKRFESLCIRAFNVLRRRARLFLNLFFLMLSSGIPELRTVDDITYLRESFLLDMSDEAAGKEFIGWIHECLNCKMTQINNAIHTFVHGG